MKKKLLLIAFSLLLIITLTGCGNKVEDNNSTTPEEHKLANDEVEIDNVIFKLDQDETGYDINYKIDSDFRKVDSGNALSYFGENGDKTYFIIRLFHYKNKSIDYAIKDTTTEYDSKEEVEVNGLKYTKVHFTNFNGANTYLFYYKNDKDVYAICFTSSEEQPRLENIFLSQIVY